MGLSRKSEKKVQISVSEEALEALLTRIEISNKYSATLVEAMEKAAKEMREAGEKAAQKLAIATKELNAAAEKARTSTRPGRSW